MFCSKCGKELSNRESFCKYCGNQLVEAQQPSFFAQHQMFMQQIEMQKQATRNNEIFHLNKAFEYFSQKKPQFDEYDDACYKMNYYAERSGRKPITAGAILSGIGCMSLFMIIYYTIMASNSQFGYLYSDDYLQFIFIPIFLLMLGIPFLIIGIVTSANAKKSRLYYTERSAILSQELYEFYLAYPNCPVGQEYVNPAILKSILDVICSRRADTIKEAINIIVDDKKKAEMAAYLETIQRNTELANAQLAELNENTRRASGYAKAGAFFAAASFLKR